MSVSILPDCSDCPHHQLGFASSDMKGSFAVNEPGVDPDLRPSCVRQLNGNEDREEGEGSQ